MKTLFGQIAEHLASGETVAVASIARGRGSAPRSKGTRCGVLADGTVLGTIGGGLLEARTVATAREALSDGRVHLLELRLDAHDLADAGMVCGGSVDIVVVPWSAAERGLAERSADILQGNGKGSLVLRWSDGGARWSLDLWTDGAWLGGGVRASGLQDLLAAPEGRPASAMRGTAEEGVFVDPLLRQRTPLIVLGAGHVGRALARVASSAHFEVTVVDDRPEFASRENVPWAERVVCRPFTGALEAVATDGDTFVVICTRGHLSDAQCTEQALRSPASYVGVIGSRRKRDMTLTYLGSLGIPKDRLEALRMPVGLAIGAETPEEIAVAVVAEMIRVRHRSPRTPAG